MAQINPETGLAYQNKSGYLYGTREYFRNHNLKSKYGITLSEWDDLFSSQGYMCAICASKEPRGKNWHTDHCHKTGEVRGILCGWCNTGIGKLQEDPCVLAIASIYIIMNNWKKSGGVQDLKKARHFLDLLIEAQE